ncbi:hypothetical protein [Cytobacillus sp. IB215316]|uniref:hypothetical protein n=1 Tax=Cytobacillus sp. IB215316 TaxID=3097354 RepID=UPI002A109669|nr:hypothetical protein [Cytobacillus sp. IB215316]MDX8363218.1 hypothetical protein [Cytobacillus sp. IB215316]
MTETNQTKMTPLMRFSIVGSLLIFTIILIYTSIDLVRYMKENLSDSSINWVESIALGEDIGINLVTRNDGSTEMEVVNGEMKEVFEVSDQDEDITLFPNESLGILGVITNEQIEQISVNDSNEKISINDSNGKIQFYFYEDYIFFYSTEKIDEPVIIKGFSSENELVGETRSS